MMHQADTVCQSMLHACDMECAKVSMSDRAEIRGRGNERNPVEEALRRGSHRLRSTIAEDGRRGEESVRRTLDHHKPNTSKNCAQINSY